MKWLIIFSLVLFSSCKTTDRFTRTPFEEADGKSSRFVEPPHHDVFWSVYKETYVLGEYDCSNKCGKYIHLLKNTGYKATLVVVVPDDYKDHGRYHVIVKVSHALPLGTMYYCPTNYEWSSRLSDFGTWKYSVDHEDMLHKKHHTNFEFEGRGTVNIEAVLRRHR